MTLETTAEKIRRIIAKADSSTHPEEATAFMAKAQKLMIENGLSMLDLGTLDQDDPVGTDRRVHSNGVSDPWRPIVANQLALFFGCRMVQTKTGTLNEWTVIGRESARITFILMWPYIDRQVLHEARISAKAGHYKTPNSARRAIGGALALRIQDLRKERESTEATAGAARGLNALVPVDIIKLEMENQFPGIKTNRAKTVNTDSYARVVADTISLYRQTGSSGGAKLRLLGKR